jgi:hypothetical protein
MEHTFQAHWIMRSQLEKDPAFAGCECLTAPNGSFRTGRPRLLWTAFGPGREVVSQRDAMSLVSKRTGKPYVVVKREEFVPPPPELGLSGLYGR